MKGMNSGLLNEYFDFLKYDLELMHPFLAWILKY